MHFARRRVPSVTAAPFGGYIESATRPPPPPPSREDLYAGGVEEEMSSDATVLCREESDHEDEIAFIYEPGEHLLDAHRREQPQGIPYCARNVNLPRGRGSFATTASLPVYRQPPPPVTNRYPLDSFQRERVHPRRRATLSWGFQQDMADFEASLSNGVRPAASAIMYPSQPSGYVIRNEMQPPTVRQTRRGSLQEPFIDVHDMDLTRHFEPRPSSNIVQQRPQQQQYPQQQLQKKPAKSRRRGRRGGRGRRNSERPADEVPKLEKKLEHELAQEMANHISNKSALAHSFSSLRLHVAGGGTMIILNDKEITGNQTKPTKELRNSQALSNAGPSMPSSDELRQTQQQFHQHQHQQQQHLQQHSEEAELQEDEGESEETARGARAKGCGAFFPPQVLKQLQHEVPGVAQYHHHLHAPSSVPTTPTSRLNVGAVPYTPTESTTASAERVSSTQQQHGGPHGKIGTGCFIPAYSQENASPSMNPSKELESVSLVESLACLENSEDVLNPSLEDNYKRNELCDAAELSCSEGSSSPVVVKEMKGSSTIAEDYAQMKSTCIDRSADLIQLIANDADYTTFTSPLHFEETLDGLQAEREAREETEQKLIDLQIENEELKSNAQRARGLEAQLQRLKEYNSALQMMLFVELNNKHRAAIRCSTPLGMAPPTKRSTSRVDITAIEAEAAKETDKIVSDTKVKESKREDRSSPVSNTKSGRPKSQMKAPAVPKPLEAKKAAKVEKKVMGVLTKTSEAAKKKENGAKDDAEQHHSNEEKSPNNLKSATAGSGVKKHPPRSKSRNQSTDGVGEDVRKNKKPLPVKHTVAAVNKHSRAASSSNALRF